MAVNSIKPLTAASATATNGSITVTVFGSVDCSRVYEGTLVQIGDFQVVEAVSGTAVDSGTGQSTITLRVAWPESTTTDKLIAWNSIEGLGQAIQRARDVVANTAAIEALSGSGLVEKTGATSYTTVPITTAGKALLDDTSNTAQRTTLGLGTAATATVTTSATDITANRLLKTADGGFMTIGQPTTEVLDDSTHQPTSFMRDADGSAFGFAAAVMNMRYNTTRQSQIAISNGGGASRMAFRTMVSNDTWDGVKEVYHSGNFSKNEITASSAGQVMAQGITVSETAIRFYRSIHNIDKPTSLTLSTSTDFDVKTLTSGVVASGVTPVINGTSSAGILVFDVTGLSGLTAGLDYNLTAASATSSIEWN